MTWGLAQTLGTTPRYWINRQLDSKLWRDGPGRRRQRGKSTSCRAYVAHLAAVTLGGVDAARKWLARDNRSLGGVRPLTLLDVPQMILKSLHVEPMDS